MLLAGVLAIGSAFTTKLHRAPCDGLTPRHWNYEAGEPYDDTVLGTCTGDPKSCTWADSGGGVFISCDDGLESFVLIP